MSFIYPPDPIVYVEKFLFKRFTIAVYFHVNIYIAMNRRILLTCRNLFLRKTPNRNP